MMQSLWSSVTRKYEGGRWAAGQDQRSDPGVHRRQRVVRVERSPELWRFWSRRYITRQNDIRRRHSAHTNTPFLLLLNLTQLLLFPTKRNKKTYVLLKSKSLFTCKIVIVLKRFKHVYWNEYLAVNWQFLKHIALNLSLYSIFIVVLSCASARLQ